jgi:hypothetical protein
MLEKARRPALAVELDSPQLIAAAMRFRTFLGVLKYSS